MKKAEGFVIRKVGNEYVIVPAGKRCEEVNETVTLSESAAFMYMHAEEAKDMGSLAELVASEYGVKKEDVYPDVVQVVTVLKQKGILL